MKRSLIKTSLVALVLGLMLAGCGGGNPSSSDSTQPSSNSSMASSDPSSESSTASSERDVLAECKAEIESSLPDSIGGDYLVTVPEGYSEVEVRMVSSNHDILTDLGTFTRPENDTTITLTIYLSYLDEADEIVHDVLALGYSAGTKIQEALDDINLSVTSTSEDFNLPTTAKYGVTVTWSTTSELVSIDGLSATVTRPKETKPDQVAKLKATVSLDEEKGEKEFEVTIIAYTVKSIELGSGFDSLKTVKNGTLNLMGCTILVTLDDDTQKEVDVTESMLSGFDSSETGPKSFAITYCGKSAQAQVSVYSVPHETTLKAGESVSEDFENAYEPHLAIDNAQTPSTVYTTDESLVVDGSRSLYFESEGSYKCLFLKSFVSFESGKMYRITFDYRLVSLVDTLYFQISGPNAFMQFGASSQVGTINSFSWLYGSTSESSLMQVFPGGGEGKTALVIDNLKIECVLVETNTVLDSLENEGDKVVETFGDSANPLFAIDTAPAPSSAVTGQDAIEGCSLLLSSDGGYLGIYLKPNAGLLPIGKYTVSFKYKVLSLIDTVYFQYYNDNVVGGYKEFGPGAEIGAISDFSFDISLTSTNTLFQFFPGGGSGKTNIIIDTLTLIRNAD